MARLVTILSLIGLAAAKDGLQDHPIVGDPIYRAKNYGLGMLPDGHPEVQRTLLHAYALRFEHPVSGETVTFRSDPPPDFEGLARFLREKLPPR